MNEAQFIKAIQTRLPSTIRVWKVHDRFTGGVPDLCLTAPNGKILWAEIKYRPRFPTRCVKPNLSAGQLDWLNWHHANGHRAIVIMGTPLGATVFTDGAWNEAKTAPTKLSYNALIAHLLDLLT